MTTLVLGATGKTGRRIVERLEARGVDVRRGSRATGFDWSDDATWAPALAGVDAVYISYYPDLSVPGAADAGEVYERFVRVDSYDGPPELAGLVAFLFGELLDGRNVATADGVQRALGRAPRDFGEYARNTASTGVWS